MPRELTLPSPDGHTYLIGTLDAMQQWSIAKRFLSQVRKERDAWEFTYERNTGRKPEEDSYREPSLNFILSAMSDEDSKQVIAVALTAVQRKHDQGGYAQIITPGTNRLQFSDMKMEALIALTFAVMRDNIDSFFTTGQPDSTAPNPA